MAVVPAEEVEVVGVSVTGLPAKVILVPVSASENVAVAPVVWGRTLVSPPVIFEAMVTLSPVELERATGPSVDILAS